MKSILVILIMLLFIGGVVWAVVVYNRAEHGQYTEGVGPGEDFHRKLESENTEPEKYITIDSRLKKKFWGSGYQLKGDLANHAGIVNYRNVLIEVKYLHSSGEELGREQLVLEGPFHNQSEKTFSVDVVPPEEAAGVSVKVVRAVGYTSYGWR